MMTREDFVKKYYADAVKATAGTGIFPQVMIAQAIIESSGKVNGNYYPGESLLAKLGNNYFGIKDSASWTGPVITLQTGEYYGGVKSYVSGDFRKYGSVEESFKDYIDFLKKNPRYTSAGVFTAKTPAEQAAALQRAGYATDPRYSSLIVAVIDNVKKWFTGSTVAFSISGLLLIGTILFFLTNNER